MRNRIVKRHAPEVVSRFSVAASCCEAAKSSDGVPHSESRRKRVTRGQRGHFVLAEKPGRDSKCSDEPSGKHAPGLQRGQAEDFARILKIEMPIDQYVEQLRANDPCQHDRDTKVPRVLRLNPLLCRIADADPKADQYANRYQHAIGGYAEIAELKKSGEHCLVF